VPDLGGGERIEGQDPEIDAVAMGRVAAKNGFVSGVRVLDEKWMGGDGPTIRARVSVCPMAPADRRTPPGFERSVWRRFPREQQKGFYHLCPDFVIELRSPPTASGDSRQRWKNTWPTALNWAGSLAPRSGRRGSTGRAAAQSAS